MPPSQSEPLTTKTVADLPLGFSVTPPTASWGINFGGGLNSTALIIECRRRGFRPDWILFADTGSELPGTIEHVEKVRQWCAGWADVTTVRWERVKGDVIGFEPLHTHCLRTGHLPSKAYGLAGCTTKWKIQPMDRWRKAHGFQEGAFAVGYDSGEARRIKTACERGDDPKFTAWYPLVAWGVDREACNRIALDAGFVVGKSSCFMCPNMRKPEWQALRAEHPAFFNLAVKIEADAAKAGNFGRSGKGLHWVGGLADIDNAPGESLPETALEDRCHHAGCFT